MMRRWIAAAAALLGLVWAAPALAVCTLPYQLQNGKISDANQVMANFNAILSCVNTPSLQVTDGSTTVMGTTEIDFTSGAVVTMGAAGVADVAVSGAAGCTGSSGDLLYWNGTACVGISGITTDGSVTLTWTATGASIDPGDLLFPDGVNLTSSGGSVNITSDTGSDYIVTTGDLLLTADSGLINLSPSSFLEINGIEGVNCTGSPTSSFVAIKGIVTHC